MAFQTVAHTSNPVQTLAFSWTIENFAKVTGSLVGPPFALFPNGLKRLKFELSVQEYDQNFTNNYTVEVNLNIQDEDKIEKQTRITEKNSSSCKEMSKVVHARSKEVHARSFAFEAVSLDEDVEDEDVEVTAQSTTYHLFQLECNVVLCTVNGKNITSAKTVFARISKNTSLKKRVLLNFFRKTAKKSEFVAFREDNKLIDLCDDKLILKAKFSVSCYDTDSSISSSTITKSQFSHDELVKNLKAMFESRPAHDLTFSVGGRSIPVHRAVVCRRSPVFCKMLEHDMVEKRSTNIAIEDAEFSTFNNFLQFLYTGEMAERDWESVLGIYSLADKYQVDSLRKECSTILSGGLAVSSFCRILVIADLHNDSELMNATKVFFRGNFSRVIQTGEWAQLVESKPELASAALGSIKEPSST